MGSVWWASILLHCLVKHVCCCTPASAQCSIPAAVDMLPFKSIVVPNNVPVVFFSATFAVSSTTNGVSFNLCLLKSAKAIRMKSLILGFWWGKPLFFLVTRNPREIFKRSHFYIISLCHPTIALPNFKDHYEADWFYIFRYKRDL